MVVLSNVVKIPSVCSTRKDGSTFLRSSKGCVPWPLNEVRHRHKIKVAKSISEPKEGASNAKAKKT